MRTQAAYCNWVFYGLDDLPAKKKQPSVSKYWLAHKAVTLTTHLASDLLCSLAMLDPRVGHTIYLCPLSFCLTLPQGVMSMSSCCPSGTCVVFIDCVHLALFLALPGNSILSFGLIFSLSATGFLTLSDDSWKDTNWKDLFVHFHPTRCQNGLIIHAIER